MKRWASDVIERFRLNFRRIEAIRAIQFTDDIGSIAATTPVLIPSLQQQDAIHLNGNLNIAFFRIENTDPNLDKSDDGNDEKYSLKSIVGSSKVFSRIETNDAELCMSTCALV